MNEREEKKEEKENVGREGRRKKTVRGGGKTDRIERRR